MEEANKITTLDNMSKGFTGDTEGRKQTRSDARRLEAGQTEGLLGETCEVPMAARVAFAALEQNLSVR